MPKTRRDAPVLVRVLTALAVLGILGAATSGSLMSKQLAEHALRSESNLKSVVSEVRLQDGLEWRAISGQPTEPLRAELVVSETRVQALLRDSSDLGLAPAAARELAQLQRRYHEVVVRELDLLDGGQQEAAAELDEESVDPAAKTLLDTLANAADMLRQRSLLLTRWSDAGVVLSVVISLIVMAALQRRLQRTRARHEQELISEARHRSLIAQATDLVMVCDSRGQVSYLSPAADRDLGQQQPDGPGLRRGRLLQECVHPEDIHSLQVMLAQERSAESADLRLGRTEQKRLTYEVSVRNLTHDPAVAGFVLTCHDVTQSRALEQSKNEFVATVSHELRTPLTSIRGYLEMLESGDFGDLRAGQRRAMVVIDRNADRLLGLVDELLMLSGMSSGRNPDDVDPVDLHELVSKGLQALDPLARTKDVSLTVLTCENSAWTVGNAEQLERLVVNLLSNAVKFTPSGGQVSVTTSTTASTLTLSVNDTGIGIPTEEQDQLFTRFFRSSHSKQHEIQGTGLGLALCQAIVESHQGTIDLTSAPGTGTCVTVTLPRHAHEPQPSHDLDCPSCEDAAHVHRSCSDTCTCVLLPVAGSMQFDDHHVEAASGLSATDGYADVTTR